MGIVKRLKRAEIVNKSEERWKTKMKMRKADAKLSEKTLLTIREASGIYSLGYNNVRKMAEEHGALRRYGSRVFVVRSVMDREILDSSEDLG